MEANQRPAAPRGGGRAGRALWGLSLALLAATLLSQATRVRGESLELSRREAELDREIGRMRRANESMRQELRALEVDPVYVESLQRRWKMVSDGERLVE